MNIWEYLKSIKIKIDTTDSYIKELLADNNNPFLCTTPKTYVWTDET